MQTGVLKTMLFGSLLPIVFLMTLMILPQRTYAQSGGGGGGGNTAQGANASCNPVDPSCPCHKMKNPETGQCDLPGANMYQCECDNTTNGQQTKGKCDAPNHCKAESSGGQGVDSALQQLGQMLQQALSKLGQGGGGGGGGGQPQTPQTGGGGDTGQTPCGSSSNNPSSVTSPFLIGSQGGAQSTTPCSASCTSYYQVSTPSSDPCAYYVPNIANSLNNATSTAGNDLLNSLNGTSSNLNTPSSPGTATDIQSGINHNFGSLIGLISNSASLFLGSTTQTIVNPDGTISTTTAYSFFGNTGAVTPPSGGDFTSFTTVANIVSGAVPQGELQIGGNGATISSSNENPQTNTAISGFFGADTTVGGASQGIAAWLCRTRPWANGFFSALFSPSFFDDLCTKRGYQVGEPPVRATAPVLTQTSVRANRSSSAANKAAATTTITVATSTVPAVPPQVQIWAVPAAVPVGSRTSVFWNTRGVASCIVTSPDGSFHQTSLSGGASTVPLTAATTFSISCLAPDGTPATDYFTVKMAI